MCVAMQPRKVVGEGRISTPTAPPLPKCPILQEECGWESYTDCPFLDCKDAKKCTKPLGVLRRKFMCVAKLQEKVGPVILKGILRGRKCPHVALCMGGIECNGDCAT